MSLFWFSDDVVQSPHWYQLDTWRERLDQPQIESVIIIVSSRFLSILIFTQVRGFGLSPQSMVPHQDATPQNQPRFM